MQLDHFFILTSPGAPQAESLSALGLQEGTPNVHRGQGTAHRRFFFEDAMLELLFMQGPAGFAGGPHERLGLVERLSSEHASPFGLVFRSMPSSTCTPFRGWSYHPPYLGAGESFLVGENSGTLEEPLCILAPFGALSNTGQARSPEPYRSVSEVRLSVPVSRSSAVLQAVAKGPRVSLQLNAPHLLEVVFQRGERGECADLRPSLPLVLRW
jgi:hypothetical protein